MSCGPFVLRSLNDTKMPAVFDEALGGHQRDAEQNLALAGTELRNRGGRCPLCAPRRANVQDLTTAARVETVGFQRCFVRSVRGYVYHSVTLNNWSRIQHKNPEQIRNTIFVVTTDILSGLANHEVPTLYQVKYLIVYHSKYCPTFYFLLIGNLLIAASEFNPKGRLAVREGTVSDLSIRASD